MEEVLLGIISRVEMHLALAPNAYWRHMYVLQFGSESVSVTLPSGRVLETALSVRSECVQHSR